MAPGAGAGLQGLQHSRLARCQEAGLGGGFRVSGRWRGAARGPTSPKSRDRQTPCPSAPACLRRRERRQPARQTGGTGGVRSGGCRKQCGQRRRLPARQAGSGRGPGGAAAARAGRVLGLQGAHRVGAAAARLAGGVRGGGGGRHAAAGGRCLGGHGGLQTGAQCDVGARGRLLGAAAGAPELPGRGLRGGS